MFKIIGNQYEAARLPQSYIAGEIRIVRLLKLGVEAFAHFFG
jgi:hypothetical protein